MKIQEIKKNIEKMISAKINNSDIMVDISENSLSLFVDVENESLLQEAYSKIKSQFKGAVKSGKDEEDAWLVIGY